MGALQVEELDRGATRFVAACENVAHYPDGVEVRCPNSEDDRDCTILTQKRDFSPSTGASAMTAAARVEPAGERLSA